MMTSLGVTGLNAGGSFVWKQELRGINERKIENKERM